MRITDLDLRRLRYFSILAEELHFGRAASLLHVSQPTLSQQLRVLEKELGVMLFERGPRGVRLTRAGELLHAEVPDALRHIEELVARVRAWAEGLTHCFRVAYSRSGISLGQRTMVEEFKKESPDVDLRVQAGWTAYNVEQLASMKLDAAFVRPPTYSDSIASMTLGAEELILVLPAEHELCKLKRVPTKLVRNEPVVMWPREQGPGLYDLILQKIWGDAPDIKQIEPNYEHVHAAVGAGAGVAVMDRRIAEDLPKTAGAVLRCFTDPIPSAGIAVAWNANHKNDLVERFTRTCRKFATRA